MIPPLVPHPSALIESMRSIGYRPKTALADLVDNCVAAGARNVQIELHPTTGKKNGWIRIVDDGCGMSEKELINAMRWGGEGPLTHRSANDLGRFGLGMKTASFSMGRRLTVISTKNKKTSAWRWDLDHISKSGTWDLLEGIDPEDESLLDRKGTKDLRTTKNGTVVLVSKVDRLRIDGHSDHRELQNSSALIESIRNHLALVFHRHIEAKTLRIRFGSAEMQAWNMFGIDSRGEEKSWQKSVEKLSGGKISVRTFILPHYKTLTSEQHLRLGGPSGWNAHQGFFIYRANRLIVPGGWLGFTRPEEHYKLARIIIDLPNDQDESWGLDVIKSKVSPPSVMKGDLERIAAAARKNGMEVYRFHGSKTAPLVEQSNEDIGTNAFWKQIQGKHDVLFRINRAHPLIEALVQSVCHKKFATAFLKAFERLLPIAAILQEPARSTHGLALEPEKEDLEALTLVFQQCLDVFLKRGHSRDRAVEILLNSEPFSTCQTELREKFEV